MHYNALALLHLYFSTYSDEVIKLDLLLDYIHVQKGDTIGISFRWGNPIQQLGDIPLGSKECTAATVGLTLSNPGSVAFGSVLETESKFDMCRHYSVLAEVVYLLNHTGTGIFHSSYKGM